MKKYQKLVFMLFLFSVVQNVWAQDSLKQEFYPILRKNVLRINLLFQGDFAYERLVWQAGKHKIGVSASFVTNKAENNNTQPSLSYSHRLYSFGTELHYLYGQRNHHLELSLHYGFRGGIVWEGEWLSGQTHFGANYRVYGGYSSHYHVRKEGTLRNDPEIQRMIEEKQTFERDNRTYQFYRYHQSAFRVGYRYQRVNGGFFLRTGITFANLIWYNDSTPARLLMLGTSVNPYDNILLLYLGLGWSF